MCGITGLLEPRGSTTADELTSRVRAMTDMLRHRGPDDTDVRVDANVGIALGHCRLSIIDLSPNGRQPMHSPCDRFTIVFNGEIYNHRALRRELERDGVRFRGHSDTEVLLALISARGIDAALPQLNGMFAFAIWDRTERCLTLVRDRVGIKPLYYGQVGTAFVFASELKAFRAHPHFDNNVNRDALSLLIQHSYVPAPHTMYANVFKLPPGCRLDVGLDLCGELPAPGSWWSMREAAERGASQPFQGTAEEAVDLLHEKLSRAAMLRLESDVPLGAFLSGGIDSSLVVSLLQSQLSERVKTFTIGFHEESYNEAQYARRIAEHLGTDHVEFSVGPGQARDVIPLLPEMFDEPFADSSQIPTYLVAQLAREHVTVALSGDGGDEFFGGYERYRHINAIAKKLAWLPRPAQAIAARLLQLPVVRRCRGHAAGQSGELFAALTMPTFEALYEFLHRHWRDPLSVVIGANEWTASGVLSEHCVRRNGRIEQMMSIDAATYLPDDILTKIDRATMAVGLEGRVPLLDHNVVEFAWTLPAHLKFSDQTGPPTARTVRSGRNVRTCQDRLRDSDRFMAAGSAARLGGRPAR